MILRDSKLLACSFVAVLTIRVSFQESQNTRNQGRDPLGQNFRNLRYKIKWNAQQKVPSSFRKFLGSHRDCSFFQKFAIFLFNRNRKISASSVEEEDSLNWRILTGNISSNYTRIHKEEYFYLTPELKIVWIERLNLSFDVLFGATSRAWQAVHVFPAKTFPKGTHTQRRKRCAVILLSGA